MSNETKDRKRAVLRRRMAVTSTRTALVFHGQGCVAAMVPPTIAPATMPGPQPRRPARAAAPPLHGLDRRCCCILQRRRRCDRHSVGGSGKRRRAYGQDGSGEKLAWQIHDLISIPDLQHRSRCNAVGQPAGLALRSVLAPRFGCDGAIHRLMPRNPRLVPTVPCAWRDQDQNLTKEIGRAHV